MMVGRIVLLAGLGKVNPAQILTFDTRLLTPFLVGGTIPCWSELRPLRIVPSGKSLEMEADRKSLWRLKIHSTFV